VSAARRRGATGLSGVLLVDKPLGYTSHDVIARLRGATGEGRIGHAGTLDPAATGLLVVLVGAATRLEPYLSAAVKRYEATIAFGSATDTDDAEGTVTETAAVDPTLADPERAREVLAGFLGEQMQRPPAFSAIKIGGQVAHRAARAGEPLAIPERSIEVYRAELLGIEGDGSQDAPLRWRVDFEVSKGTYIRSLARDIAEAAGTRGHLCGLRRMASGSLQLADAVSLDEALEAARAGGLSALWADPVFALGFAAAAGPIDDIAQGRAIAVPEGCEVADGAPVALADDASVHAIYRREGDMLKPQAVFPGGIARGGS
jgi:tRNA pseudouridine55 synthase